MAVRLVEPDPPEQAVAVAARLEAAGHASWLTGACLADLLCGRACRSFSLLTAAGPADVAAVLPRAVPTLRGGAAWQVPTAAGPVDVLPQRPDSSLADELAARRLTRHAIAWSPVRGERIDPFAGTTDLAEGRIRTTRPAQALVHDFPIAALEAARLVATREAVVDAELEKAMAGLERADVERIPTADRRREVRAMLAGPGAGAAAALLARTGLDGALGVRSRPDTEALLAVAPEDPALRLAIWLRGSRSGRFMRALRMPRALGDEVLGLLAHHPVERSFSARRRASVARLARLPEAQRERLMWLRARELEVGGEDASAREALDALRAAVERFLADQEKARRAPPLALSGDDVMRTLGIDPGREVGEALAFLRSRVAEDARANTTDRLAELLVAWWDERRATTPGAP